jgi:hypothetical protein
MGQARGIFKDLKKNNLATTLVQGLGYPAPCGSQDSDIKCCAICSDSFGFRRLAPKHRQFIVGYKTIL